MPVIAVIFFSFLGLVAAAYLSFIIIGITQILFDDLDIDIEQRVSEYRSTKKDRRSVPREHRKHWQCYLEGREQGEEVAKWSDFISERQSWEERGLVQEMTRAEFDAYVAGRRAGVEQYNEQETLGRARTDYLSDLDAAQARYRKGLAELEDEFARLDRDIEK